MNTLVPNLLYDSNIPLYIQLYNYIKKEILSGRLSSGEKLPSLRGFAVNLKLSVTTIELAYNQLLVEGYINSREKSGYFVCDIQEALKLPPVYHPPVIGNKKPDINNIEKYADPNLFDFVKWKKCINQVINDYPDQLAREASTEGEAPLRKEISHYLYMARGVFCNPDDIVIAAGTQQIINLIASFLDAMNINNLAYEDPGYLPAVRIFKDRGFKVTPVPLDSTGINLSELRKIDPSVIFVSPSNQFPTGIVMPISSRYSLLRYAGETGKIIIEDDYVSELRYFGRPIPPLRSLDKNDIVIYLGSFSSVLFPSTRISYMVLPHKLMPHYEEVLSTYTQTCSKTEQLALSIYMQKGLFQIHIKKLRKLYSQKITSSIDALEKLFGSQVNIKTNQSGLNMLLEVKTSKSSLTLSLEAKSVGLEIIPITNYTTIKKDEGNPVLIFYYASIPLKEIPSALKKLADTWKLSEFI